MCRTLETLMCKICLCLPAFRLCARILSSRHSLGSCWSPVGCSEEEKEVAAVAADAAGVAVGAVVPGPLHAGIVGRVDRVGAAPLACCWCPKQLPKEDRRSQNTDYKKTRDVVWFNYTFPSQTGQKQWQLFMVLAEIYLDLLYYC